MYKNNKLCKINILLVNNNCFANYLLHNYLKFRLSHTDYKDSNIRLITYSIKPFIKYLYLLLIINQTPFFKNAFNDLVIDLPCQGQLLKQKILKKSNSYDLKLLINKMYTENIDEEENNLLNIENDISNLCDLIDDTDILNSVIKYIKKPYNFHDDNIINSLLLNSFNSILNILKGNETDIDVKHMMDKSIKEFNKECRREDFINKFVNPEFFRLGWEIYEIFTPEVLKKIVKKSFDDQKDIIFIPIEPNNIKREKIRRMKLSQFI